MDFGRLTEALASKSYDKIADICDDLMLQATIFSLFFVNFNFPFSFSIRFPIHNLNYPL